jgi:hypothetical protein
MYIGSFGHATCAALNFKETFMVQFCCGDDDCKAAGLGKRSVKFGSEYLDARSGGGSGGAYLHYPNGTKIEPLFEGPPVGATSRKGRMDAGSTSDFVKPANTQQRRQATAPSTCPAGAVGMKRDLTENQIVQRDCSPDSGSWIAAAESYTRPAENVSIVLDSVNGGTGGNQITFTSTKSQTWTSSVEMSFGFADVVSLGLSFKQDYSCELSQTSQYTFSIPPNQVGAVGFTAFLECQQGKKPTLKSC